MIEMHLYNVKMNNPNYGTLYDVRYDQDTDTFHMGKWKAQFKDGNINLFVINKKIKSFKYLSLELCDIILLKKPTNLLNNSNIETFMKWFKLTNATYKVYDVRGGLNVTNC